MIRKRPATERGHFDHGWLETWHSFSFGEYRDPEHMGFRGLRVINDDVIQAGQGFGKHGHRDMEIITYVLDGALEHQDSMGNTASSTTPPTRPCACCRSGSCRSVRGSRRAGRRSGSSRRKSRDSCGWSSRPMGPTDR